MRYALRAPAYAGMALVHAYRWTFGVLWGGSCKYHPSCSRYALDALRHYGLLRCNPWSHGGVDYAQDQRLFR